MSRTIQRYQIEFGLAIARELQRNQERRRRGKTPLQPSLDNKGNQVQSAAASDATTRRTRRRRNAVNTAYSNSAEPGERSAERRLELRSPARQPGQPPRPLGRLDHVGYGRRHPHGYTDTGYTINLASGVNRRVIRKQ